MFNNKNEYLELFDDIHNKILETKDGMRYFILGQKIDKLDFDLYLSELNLDRKYPNIVRVSRIGEEKILYVKLSFLLNLGQLSKNIKLVVVEDDVLVRDCILYLYYSSMDYTIKRNLINIEFQCDISGYYFEILNNFLCVIDMDILNQFYDCYFIEEYELKESTIEYESLTLESLDILLKNNVKIDINSFLVKVKENSLNQVLNLLSLDFKYYGIFSRNKYKWDIEIRSKEELIKFIDNILVLENSIIWNLTISYYDIIDYNIEKYLKEISKTLLSKGFRIELFSYHSLHKYLSFNGLIH